MPMQVEIITPERTVARLEADEVGISTLDGRIGVRTGHAPLVAPLVPGEVTIAKDGKKEFFAVSGGFVQVDGKNVRVLADAAEHSEEINEIEIQEAIERAKQAKADSTDRIEIAEAIKMIELNTARQKTMKKRHGHGSHYNPTDTIL